jgi:hypothetical protein
MKSADHTVLEQPRSFVDPDAETRDDWRRAPVSMLLWSIVQGRLRPETDDDPTSPPLTEPRARL